MWQGWAQLWLPPCSCDPGEVTGRLGSRGRGTCPSWAVTTSPLVPTAVPLCSCRSSRSGWDAQGGPSLQPSSAQLPGGDTGDSFRANTSPHCICPSAPSLAPGRARELQAGSAEMLQLSPSPSCALHAFSGLWASAWHWAHGLSPTSSLPLLTFPPLLPLPPSHHLTHSPVVSQLCGFEGPGWWLWERQGWQVAQAVCCLKEQCVPVSPCPGQELCSHWVPEEEPTPEGIFPAAL